MMAQASDLSLNLVRLAAKNKLRLVNLPLKNKSTAKILWNENEVDCFIVKNGKILGGKGSRGSLENMQNELAFLLDKFQDKVADGVDIMKNFADSFRKVK